MGGRVDLIKSRPCVLSFSLSVSHMDVLPRNPYFFCVPFCFFLPPFVFLSLPLSRCLSPLFHLSVRTPEAAAGKVLFLFLLIFHFCTLSACSSCHASFLFIRPSSQLTSVLVYSSLFSIVHHGTALTQTQLNLKLTCIGSLTASHRYHLIFCANHKKIPLEPKGGSHSHTHTNTPIHVYTRPAVYHLV